MIHFSVQKRQGTWQLALNGTLLSGQVTAIMGPSGAGKSTFLRLLAGLEKPDEGFITVDGVDWYRAPHTHLPPHQRALGMVFQDYALFPHFTVAQNIAYGACDLPWQNHLLSLTGLQAYRHVKPSQLSGGQQQRVALVRALARRPRLLLLDEPLSALDTQWREQLQADLARLQREYAFTTVLVSHDFTEVQRLAQQIWYLQEGQIQTAPADSVNCPTTHIFGRVLHKTRTTHGWEIHLQCPAQTLSVHLSDPAAQFLQPGESVSASVNNVVPHGLMANAKWPRHPPVQSSALEQPE